MAEQLRMILILVVSIMLMIMGLEISQYSRATKYLKEDLEVSLHDASLQIDKADLSEGNIVFNRDQAMSAFKETLEMNADITTSDYKIVDFKVLDDSNTTFPHTYESPNTDFSDIFFYPSIIAIIETETGTFFGPSRHDQTVRQVASYTYQYQ